MIDWYDENEVKKAEDLLDTVDLPLPQLSDEELLALHGKILQKAGITPLKKQRPKWKKIAGLAAAFLFCAVGSGFAVLQVSDVFRMPLQNTMMPSAVTGYGVGKSAQSDTADREDGAAAQFYSENTVNDMGSLLWQSDTSAGVKITARGVISDDNTLMVLMQAECAENPDLLTGELSFENAVLTVEQTGAIEYCNASFVPNSASGAQFLLHQQTQGGLIGSSVSLTLENLFQWQQSDGVDMELTTQTLFGAIEQLPKENVNSLITEYYTEEEAAYYIAEGVTIEKDATGKAVMCRNLQNTDFAGIAFSAAYPDLRLVAAAVENNTLYLRVEGPTMKASRADRLQTIGVKNLQSGEVLTAYSMSSGSTDESFSMDVEIEGISSLEDLKNYTLVADAGWIMETVAAGTWNFSFDLTMQNTSQQIETSQVLQFYNGKMKLDKLEVSPISISLSGHVLTGDNFNMPQSQGVMLQNGTVIDLYEASGSYDYTTGVVEMRFFLPGVISRSNLKSLLLGENIIPLN